MRKIDLGVKQRKQSQGQVWVDGGSEKEEQMREKQISLIDDWKPEEEVIDCQHYKRAQ